MCYDVNYGEITELFVVESRRRQGVASSLMAFIETQSRNENAIAFYLAYGFTLIGFNACEYQNNDFERKEVRMEMGILL